VSHRLAIRAKNGLKCGGYPKGRGLCQSYARRCYENEYGKIFHDSNPPTAHEAAKYWESTPYAHPGGNWGQVGDLFYWFATKGQPAGHVSIRIEGNQVAENSIVHYGDDCDGRGTRKFSELRRFPDLIVRLPASHPAESPD
jgi:hypothetical protein